MITLHNFFQEGNPFYLFGPVVDDFMPAEQRIVIEPLRGIRDHAAKSVPIIAGLAEDDGSVMLCKHKRY